LVSVEPKINLDDLVFDLALTIDDNVCVREITTHLECGQTDAGLSTALVQGSGSGSGDGIEVCSGSISTTKDGERTTSLSLDHAAIDLNGDQGGVDMELHGTINGDEIEFKTTLLYDLDDGFNLDVDATAVIEHESGVTDTLQTELDCATTKGDSEVMQCSGGIVMDDNTGAPVNMLTLKQLEVDLNSGVTMGMAAERGHGATDVSTAITWGNNTISLNPFVLSTRKYGRGHSGLVFDSNVYTDPATCVARNCAAQIRACNNDATCKDAWAWIQTSGTGAQIPFSAMMAAPLLIHLDKCSATHCAPVSTDFRAQFGMDTMVDTIAEFVGGLVAAVEMQVSERHANGPNRMDLSFGATDSIREIAARPWLMNSNTAGATETDGDDDITSVDPAVIEFVGDFDLSAEVEKLLTTAGLAPDKIAGIVASLNGLPGEQTDAIVKAVLVTGTPDMTKLLDENVFKETLTEAGVSTATIAQAAKDYKYVSNGDGDGNGDASGGGAGAAIGGAVAGVLLVALVGVLVLSNKNSSPPAAAAAAPMLNPTAEKKNKAEMTGNASIAKVEAAAPTSFDNPMYEETPGTKLADSPAEDGDMDL